MSKRMLIDATHEEETRVAIVDGNKLAEYDYESSSRKPIKGNIYLAKVTRVEPSLQAAFVNFGGNRHGFLPFSEIHPDYFRIPIADREALMAEQEALIAAQEAEFEKEAAADAMAAAEEASGVTGGAEQDEYGSQEDIIKDNEDIDEDYIVEELGGLVEGLEDIDSNSDINNNSNSNSQTERAIPANVPVVEIVDQDDEWAEEGEGSDELIVSDVEMQIPMEQVNGDENNQPVQEGDISEGEGNSEDGRDFRGRRGRGRRGREGGGRRGQFRNKRSENGGEDEMSGEERFRFNLRRKYKIQEVIKRGQIMLVQANKEERGNKGAAVGTYLSLPGRYCVLMPNSPRAGGVSRKIANYKDRARMREIMKELEVPKGMSVIVRTAGVARTKVEIKRDLDYLMRLWDSIRELTLQSTAPSLVYEEADLIKRAIRDLYTREVEDIVVAGENGFKTARNFMKMMVPSHIKKVNQYEENLIPLFTRYQIETQIQEIGMPSVRLRSGGYLVINPTEALVSIDVNSGKATKERHIEETALKTNLEAADEVARQLRLRDLGGLVVIDFIDMEDRRNNAKVERRLKEALSTDRARVQVGRISSFGLLELSRQRLSPSLTESQYETCAHCKGVGVIRTSEAMSIVVLRAIEEEGIRARAEQIKVYVSNAVALYILNNKRKSVVELENRYGFEVVLLVDEEIPGSEYRLEISKSSASNTETTDEVDVDGASGDESSSSDDRNQNRSERESSRGKRDRNRRGGRKHTNENRGGVEEQKHTESNASLVTESDSLYGSDEDLINEDDDNFGNTIEGAEQSAFRANTNNNFDNQNAAKRNRNRRRGGRNRNRRDRTTNKEGSQEIGGHFVHQSGTRADRQQTRSEMTNSSNDYTQNQQRHEHQTKSERQFESSETISTRAPQPKKEPQSSASYEVVSEPTKEKKRGWWNRLVE